MAGPVAKTLSSKVAPGKRAKQEMPKPSLSVLAQNYVPDEQSDRIKSNSISLLNELTVYS